MDIFTQSNNNISLEDNNITIFGKKMGRNSNTYVIGWKASDEEYKKTLDKLKKQLGCGGTIKKIEYEGKEYNALHLQGDKVFKVETFFKNMNINNLIVKEIIT